MKLEDEGKKHVLFSFWYQNGTNIEKYVFLQHNIKRKEYYYDCSQQQRVQDKYDELFH